MVSAVVFDLDDTLYPERDYVQSGFRAVASAFEEVLGDRNTSVARMNDLLLSPDRTRVFDVLLNERRRQDRALLQDMIETYRSHHPSIELFPDVRPALDRLRLSHRLGLLTDGRPSTQRLKIEALQLAEQFSEIIVTGELGANQSKPACLPFELMAETLRSQHRQCAYVGDNPAKDFLSPNALGWKSIQIRRPMALYADAPAPDRGSACHVIESLSELDHLLD